MLRVIRIIDGHRQRVAKTVLASSNETLCALRLVSAFFGSHSNSSAMVQSTSVSRWLPAWQPGLYLLLVRPMFAVTYIARSGPENRFSPATRVIRCSRRDAGSAAAQGQVAQSVLATTFV
jgi:hypothetical protein